MPIQQITAGVFQLRCGRINAWLLHAGRFAVLCDAGLPGHARRILGWLDELGLPHRRVAAILLTHSHLDHSGGASLLARACEAPVYVHGADAAAVEGRGRLSPCRGGLLGAALEPLIGWSDRRLFGYRPVRVEPVAAGFRFEGLELVHLPGHTPGHCGFFDRARSVVFAGDAAVCWGRGRLSGPSALFSLDPDQVRRSQLRLAELDAAWTCLGHGPPLARGARALRRLAGA